jgi:hypothetical protein
MMVPTRPAPLLKMSMCIHKLDDDKTVTNAAYFESVHRCCQEFGRGVNSSQYLRWFLINAKIILVKNVEIFFKFN